jgi:hypothetical protein
MGAGGREGAGAADLEDLEEKRAAVPGPAVPEAASRAGRGAGRGRLSPVAGRGGPHLLAGAGGRLV